MKIKEEKYKTPHPASPVRGGVLLILLLLLLVSGVMAQDFDFGFDFHGKRSAVFTGKIVPTKLVITNGVVYPYDDFAMQMAPPQYGKLLHKNKLATPFDTLTLIWQEYFSGGASLNYIIAQQGQFTAAFLLKRESNITKLQLRSTTRNLDTLTFAGWVSYKLTLLNGDLKLWRNDTLKASYSSMTVDTMTDLTSRALVIGDDYQLEAQGIANIVSNGGTYTGKLDSIYFYVDGDTLIDCNFNNGVLMLSDRQWYRWANMDAHDFRYYNIVGGMTNMAFNYWFPNLIYVSGGRRDTNKTFTLPLNALNGGGVRLHTGTEYGRATFNDIKVSPSGTVAIGIGIFTHTDDSTNVSSKNIAKWNGTAWVDLDTGMAASMFPYDGEWINDTGYCCSYVNGSERGILIFNTNTGANYRKVVDTVVVGLTVLRDTIWYTDRSRLRGLNPFNLNATTRYVFTETISDLSANSAIGKGGDTLIVAAGLHVYWLRNGSLLQTLDFLPYTAVDKYSIGGVWYDGIKRASDGTDWFCGDYKGIGTNSGMGGIGYVRNGVAYGIGGLQGGSGDCDAYAPSCKEGAFTLMATSIAEPFAGEFIITGTFRKINNVYTGNTAYYNRSGVYPLDYGSAWTVWQVDTITNGGYKDLIFCGDGIEVNGMKSNCVWGRYLDAHFRVLTPQVTTSNVPVNVNPANWPPTMNLATFSKQQRQLTATTYYRINSGARKTFSFSKTDSSLTNVKAGWAHNWTGTFGAQDTVASGNTVTVDSLVVRDDYGNKWDTTFTFNVINPQFTFPSDYVAAYRKDTITSSPVTNWLSRGSGTTLTQATTVLKPTWASGTGLYFDSMKLGATPPVMNSPTGDSGAVILIMNVQDTNLNVSGNTQTVLHIRESADMIIALNIGNQTASSTKKFGTSFYNGSGVTNRCFVFPTADLFNKYALVVINYDSLGAQTVWVNGTQLTSPSASFQAYPSGTYWGLGLNESFAGRFKGYIEYYIQYKRNVTSAEISSMQTSAVNAGLIR